MNIEPEGRPRQGRRFFSEFGTVSTTFQGPFHLQQKEVPQDVKISPAMFDLFLMAMFPPLETTTAMLLF